jgi:GNAT superfamily N-acetyltransferase
MTLVLRNAKKTDAAAISALLGQLGYPAQSKEIPARLRALGGHPGSMTCVAELNKKVVGVMSAQVFPAIHTSEPVAWLTALVVDEAARGVGVGQQMVAYAEAWAAGQGAAKLALTSALHRERAHSFYKALGYQHTGVRLAKPLGG